MSIAASPIDWAASPARGAVRPTRPVGTRLLRPSAMCASLATELPSVFTEAVPATSNPRAPTRDRLLDEAMRLFGERGYDATSVAEIERAAGLTPGAGGLFHHFSSKEDVLRV